MTLALTSRGEGFVEFWTERHLCTLTTVRPDGTAHVVPVGVTLDIETGTARVICSRSSQKAKLARAAGERGTAVAICQVDGKRWSTLEGRAVLREEPAAVADAEARYARRYRTPRVNPQRVVLEIAVSRVLGNA